MAAFGALIGGILTQFYTEFATEREPQLLVSLVHILAYAVFMELSQKYQRTHDAVVMVGLANAMSSINDIHKEHNELLENHDKILSNRFKTVKYYDEETESFQWRFEFEE